MEDTEVDCGSQHREGSDEDALQPPQQVHEEGVQANTKPENARDVPLA